MRMTSSVTTNFTRPMNSRIPSPPTGGHCSPILGGIEPLERALPRFLPSVPTISRIEMRAFPYVSATVPSGFQPRLNTILFVVILSRIRVTPRRGQPHDHSARMLGPRDEIVFSRGYRPRRRHRADSRPHERVTSSQLKRLRSSPSSQRVVAEEPPPHALLIVAGAAQRQGTQRSRDTRATLATLPP